MARKNKRNQRKNLVQVVRCFCEGETEAEYIKVFINDRYKDYAFKTTVYKDPRTIVDKFKRTKKQNKDDIYVLIFDNDGRNTVASIIQEAKKEGAFVYYSNLCFELWLLLHFKDYHPSHVEHQKSYYKELEKRLNINNYEQYKGYRIIELLKNKSFDLEMNHKINERYPNLNDTNDVRLIEQNPYTNVGYIEQDVINKKS